MLDDDDDHEQVCRSIETASEPARGGPHAVGVGPELVPPRHGDNGGSAERRPSAHRGTSPARRSAHNRRARGEQELLTPAATKDAASRRRQPARGTSCARPGPGRDARASCWPRAPSCCSGDPVIVIDAPRSACAASARTRHPAAAATNTGTPAKKICSPPTGSAPRRGTCTRQGPMLTKLTHCSARWFSRERGRAARRPATTPTATSAPRPPGRRSRRRQHPAHERPGATAARRSAPRGPSTRAKRHSATTPTTHRIPTKTPLSIQQNHPRSTTPCSSAGARLLIAAMNPAGIHGRPDRSDDAPGVHTVATPGSRTGSGPDRHGRPHWPRRGCDEPALHNVLGHLETRGVRRARARPLRRSLTPGARCSGRRSWTSRDRGRFAPRGDDPPTCGPAARLCRAAPAARSGTTLRPTPPSRPSSTTRSARRQPTPEPESTHRLGGSRTVVDVGGGTGDAAARACFAALRTCAATLVDLPGTVARHEGPFETARAELLRGAPRGRRPLRPAQRAQRLAGRRDRRDPGARRRGAGAGRQPAARQRTASPRTTSSGGWTIEMVLLGGRTDSLAAFRERAARAGLEVVRRGAAGRRAVLRGARRRIWMAYDEQLAARDQRPDARAPRRRRAQDVRRHGLDDRRQHGRRRDARGPPGRPAPARGGRRRRSASRTCTSSAARARSR